MVTKSFSTTSIFQNYGIKKNHSEIVTHLSIAYSDVRRRTWQPTPVFLPGESPWTEEPGGLQSIWSPRADITEQLSTHTLRWKDKFNGYTYHFPSMFNDKSFSVGNIGNILCSLSLELQAKGNIYPLKDISILAQYTEPPETAWWMGQICPI